METYDETLSPLQKGIVYTSMIVSIVFSLVALIGVVVLWPVFSSWIQSWPVLLAFLYFILLFATIIVYVVTLFPSGRAFIEDTLPPSGDLVVSVAMIVITRFNILLFFGFVCTTVFGMIGAPIGLSVIALALFAIAEIALAFNKVFEWGVEDTRQQLKEAASHPQNS